MNLPELPRCARMANLPGTDEYACEPVFTADQMRAYATQAVLAERERWRLLLSPDHIYLGDCPDVENPDRRDAECPVCARMKELE